MKNVLVITPDEAAALIQDYDVVTVNGFVCSVQPEALSAAIEKRFLETGEPRQITLYHCAGQGNSDGRGSEHFAHEGMLKRVIAGHYGSAPKLAELIKDNKVEAYNFPQGTLAQHYRDVSAQRIGTFTSVGLETFADPRISGGKMNDYTTEELVWFHVINGEEQLFYPRMHMNAALIRGTYADEWGNVTMTKEIASVDALAQAMAVHACGGKVIVQVEKIMRGGTLDPRLVKIPGIYVDYLAEVSPEEKGQYQTFDHTCDPSLCGEGVVSVHSLQAVPLSAKKVIARRAALELMKFPGMPVINLGIGIPELVAAVAAEEGMENRMTMTVESGVVGGVPLHGMRFGASMNAECCVDQASQFDFYDGGGLDAACLGFAQCDVYGNVNASRFGEHIAGCGGFIDISQHTRNVIFCGTFTTGGLKECFRNGALHIEQEGTVKKFINEIDQITFSGSYARKHKQHILYITERAVFEMKSDGMHLIEIAPGINLQKDILSQMEFIPIIDTVGYMAPEIFEDTPMRLNTIV